jgi:DNA mismatch repair protein MutS
MPPKPQSIYDEYFRITKQYIDQYGEMTILFYQVGAFFEMYGLQDGDGAVLKSKVGDLTQIAQLKMSAKDIDTPDGAVIMAGFRDYSLDKYLKIATQNGYTSVVYTQNMTNPKDIKRELYGIYSPGTFISYDTDSTISLTNHIVCVWLSTYTPFGSKGTSIICGLSSVHIFTGESTLFEYQTPFIMNPTTFDELERYISVMSPSEVIFISFLSEKQTNQAIQFSNIRTPTIHKIVMETEQNPKKMEAVENCQKQKYIKHILSGFFGSETFDVCKEFNINVYATQSFCYLVNFIQEHNPDLVRRLSIPVFQNSGSRMVLANHTLKQLNIIDDQTIDGKSSGRFSSVLSFLNKCVTPMGRRLFQIQMTNPVFDSQWLNSEYDATGTLLDKGPIILSDIRRSLSKIKDLEKISRQIVAKRVYPSSIYFLYEGIRSIRQINETDMGLESYLGSQTHIRKEASNIIDRLDSVLLIEKCKGVDSVSIFDENIIQPGIYENLDQTVREYNRDLKLFETVRSVLNNLMRSAENKGEEVDYIKVHETEKSGSSLQVTKKRGQLLQQLISGISSKVIEFSPDFIIPVKDIRFVKASSSNDEIDFPQLTALTKRLLIWKGKFSEEVAKAFANVMRKLENDHYDSIESLIRWLSRIDVIQSKTYVAAQYRYCRPIIESEASHAFFSAEGIRHVLIEQLQQNELYVTNDLTLSESENMNRGILIFGTNAVGKTSFIRAIGICIIMAQCGIYVPCSKFIYKPYTAIFSRILGNDNIFKGLSTFAVEMSELRIILKMADENSLVLGDELCSGTESESALAIFSTGLKELHEKRTTFLFATHLHEITKYEEINDLDHMGLTHMTVHYDVSVDGLVYDRKLKEGQGDRMYGLEVCKSLYMDDGFLERAYAFRNKYFEGGELNHKSSVYNAKKIRGICEICHIEISEEVHHLIPQKKADSAGFIGDEFHKNHVANLAAVCEKCHKKMHTMPDMQRRKTTSGYHILPVSK